MATAALFAALLPIALILASSLLLATRDLGTKASARPSVPPQIPVRSPFSLQSALKFGAGLINEVLQTHERIMTTVQTFLEHVADDYAERYSMGVAQAVRSYTTSDVNASARLDTTLPGVIDPSVPAHLADQSVGPEVFADHDSLVLHPPPDYEAQYPYHPTWYDLMSPASIPRDAVWYVTIPDIVSNLWADVPAVIKSITVS